MTMEFGAAEALVMARILRNGDRGTQTHRVRPDSTARTEATIYHLPAALTSGCSIIDKGTARPDYIRIISGLSFGSCVAAQPRDPAG